jgi:hypothetical protein
METKETVVPVFAFRNLEKPRKPYIRRFHIPHSKRRPLEFEAMFEYTFLSFNISHTSHESNFNLFHQEESISCGDYSRQDRFTENRWM